MSTEKILVLNSTGKVGRNVCRALREAGFEVYGTTRSSNNTLAAQGVKPVVCNYTLRADLDRALVQSGAKKYLSSLTILALPRKALISSFSKAAPPSMPPRRPGLSTWCS